MLRVNVHLITRVSYVLSILYIFKRIKLFIFILLSLGYHYTCIIIGVNLVTLTILHVVLCHFAWTEFTDS